MGWPQAAAIAHTARRCSPDKDAVASQAPWERQWPQGSREAGSSALVVGGAALLVEVESQHTEGDVCGQRRNRGCIRRPELTLSAVLVCKVDAGDRAIMRRDRARVVEERNAAVLVRVRDDRLGLVPRVGLQQRTCDHDSGMLPRSCTAAASSPLPVSRICSDSTKLATSPAMSAPRRQCRVPARCGARRAMSVMEIVSRLTPAATGAAAICRTKPRMHGITNASAPASAAYAPSPQMLHSPRGAAPHALHAAHRPPVHRAGEPCRTAQQPHAAAPSQDCMRGCAAVLCVGHGVAPQSGCERC
jgi:hypothetical protein